ncbi:hypothetical protein [Kitasatospora sp. NPDC086791]|uniref:hypothetical protein n=1 Tax=Kitasatospora sp. NPDC086791 TaxID=3155178 RepID=UPI003447C494
MRVKLRPGTHFAPVRQGVHFARAGKAFVLAGPPTLYRLLDSRIDLLDAGTDSEALIAALGGEPARPVVEHVLRTLLAQDVLLDLDALTVPEPDPAAAARHAEVIGYLEARSDDPYRVLAELRAATVAVLGAGPAAEVLTRSLAAYGIGRVRADSGGAADALTVLVDDADRPLDLDAALAGLPSDAAVLPVHAGARTAVVGAVTAAGAGTGAFAAAVHRAAGWAAADPESAAPRPLSALLAGALAAHTALGELSGLDRGRAPAAVYGREARSAALAPPADPPLPRWEAVTAATGAVTAPTGAVTAPTGAVTAEEPLTAERLTAAWAPLEAPRRGLWLRGRDLDLPQVPVPLATATVVGTRTGQQPVRVAGWGTDRPSASLSTMLAAARRVAALHRDPTAGVPAAGATRDHWLLDGALRVLGPEALALAPEAVLGWTDLDSAEQRTLWSLLDEYFGRNVRAVRHRLPGLSWVLTAVTDADGEVRAAEWGPSPTAATRTALAAAVAQAQADPATRALLAGPADPAGPVGPAVGTAELALAPGGAVRSLAAELSRAAADRGGALRGERLRHDGVLGELPLFLGPVRLS